MAMTYELYKDKAGEHRWRLKHQNGNILATSSEGYSSKAAALKSIENVKASADSPVVEL
ncbi:MAG: YegP family protein [Sphingomonadaceae bacterium]